MECEEKISSTINSLNDTESKADLLFAREFVGRTALESAALLETYKNFTGKLHASNLRN